MAAKNKPNEIYITRTYDAPLKMVWDAFTDPKQKAHWWGPRGFTITTHSSDIRTGGMWHYTMHGPDGTDYVNKTKFHEVEKHSRLVYDHGGNDEQAPLFHVTILFSEKSGKTTMDMTMAFPSPEVAANMKKFIKQASGDSTWDRLAEHLSPSEDIFVINRSFDAPIDTVFDAWTDPQQIAKWLPPTGSTMAFIRAEVKVGGTSFYSMSAANGMAMYGKISYREITKPNRIVYTQIFCDENGTVSRHPMAPTWPETMLTTVTLTEEGTNRTRVTIRWEVEGVATSEERATFHQAKGGMTQGWTGSFDKLEAFIG